jgi:antitoxin component YwqK of YwqJK toxin-antitoxin module
MAAKPPRADPHLHYHKDGTLWAKGQTVAGVMSGYWEWFRKDGTRMRSGYFVDGVQTGEWTTYDRKGKVYKVTTMKPKTANAVTAKPAKKRAKKKAKR